MEDWVGEPVWSTLTPGSQNQGWAESQGTSWRQNSEEAPDKAERRNVLCNWPDLLKKVVGVFMRGWGHGSNTGREFLTPHA